MKYSAIAIAAFAGVVAAQLPACAQPCIAASVAKVTNCAPTDQACQCLPENRSAIQADATTCVLASCSDPIAVLTAAQAACANLPPAPASSAPPPPPVSSAAPPATSAAAPATSAAAPASTPAAPASSAAPATSAAVPAPYPTSVATSVKPATSAVGTGAAYPTGIVPYVPGSGASTFGASGVFAVVMAALAAF